MRSDRPAREAGTDTQALTLEDFDTLNSNGGGWGVEGDFEEGRGEGEYEFWKGELGRVMENFGLLMFEG